MAFVFSHGGDYGDSVFSLMVLHELWRETGEQTDYRLYHRLGTRMAMDEKHAAGLLPLIRSQPYIRSAEWSPHPIGVRLCESTRRNFNPHFNLADMYTNAFGLPVADRRLPWLYVEPRAIAPVVVHRSPRYRSQFPWTKVYQKIKDRAVFVGLPDEHRDFSRAIGKLPYYPTADMAELASVIAGCRLYVGNQSAPAACAEGTKRPLLLERPHDTFVTHWDRPDAWYAHKVRDPLPDIDKLLGLPDAEGVRLDHGSLAVGAPDKRYNGGILEDGDSGYLIAFRAGPVSVYGGPSRVWVARLDRDFRPTGEARQLRLDHPECSHSQEDPRLFRYRGRVHVSFTGVSGAGAEARPPSVLYCELDGDLRPGRVFYPHYDGRAAWEKNWVFFEYDGGLHAVYSIRPHVVLRIDGDKATEVARTDGPPQWGSGVMRGGASPVLIGDRHYHFFHGKREEPGGRQSYHTGCLTFDSRPPFRVLSYTPHPLHSADRTGLHSNGGPDDVAFVGGAVRTGGDWVVSLGFADQWIEIRRWSAADVEAALVRV